MLDAVRRFFETRLQGSPSRGLGPEGLALASAALLFEVSRADDRVDASERRRLRTLLRTEFSLDEADLDELEALAEQEVEEATDLYQFTRLVTEHCDAEQRVALVERMWSVAWADGAIDPLEEHIIRRVAGLLHVRHSDFVAARLRTRPAAVDREDTDDEAAD